MKTQILKFEQHEDNTGKYYPIYCPYTGEKLSGEDPFDESINESSYPSSVLMAWAGDEICFDEPFYSIENLNLTSALFEDVYSVEDCALKLDELSQPNGYILVSIESYGHRSGDYGRIIYLLGKHIL